MSPAPASDTQTRDSHSLFAALEAELAQGASRGADKLAPYAAGGLERAAESTPQKGSWTQQKPSGAKKKVYIAHLRVSECIDI